jgi:Zn-dependent metalloprotease
LGLSEEERLFKQLFTILTVLGILSTQLKGQSQSDRRRGPLPDFDIRESQRSTDQTGELRKAVLASFASSADQMQLGTRLVPNDYGLPKLFLRDGRTLTTPSPLKSTEVAKSFLRAQSGIFFLNAAEIDGLRVLTDDVSDGANFLSFNQTLNGIDVFNGQIKFTLNKDGSIIQVATGNIVPGLSISTTPKIAAEDAVKAASISVGSALLNALSRTPDSNGKTAFLNPRGGTYSPITTELSIFPMNATSARLAYRTFLEVDPRSWYEILIDANDGTVLFRHNLYVNAIQGRVWTESPLKGTRTLVTFPDNWFLSPAATTTTGNNVDAYLDTNGDDKPDVTTDTNMSTGRASSPAQLFDFDFGDGTLNLDPRLYRPAAITNVFYLVNTAHDFFYSLGFNEAAGNFQTNNADKGGIGGDAVLAEVQFGDLFGFSDSPALSPTPEGTAPKMRLPLITRGTPSKTDDLDPAYGGMAIIHEYGHGVSTRLVGAKTSTTCLMKIQSGAMAEGWSDYFAISFYDNPVFDAYLSGNSTRGIRRFSYEGYPLTYEDIGNGTHGYEVHDDGEIWAGTLWDLRKSLGAAVTDRLVLNGLKNTPCNPSMTDARDAILSADAATNNGANRAAIWKVFAAHGLGFSAVGVDGTVLSGTRYDAAYNLPPDLQTTLNPAITSNPLTILAGFGLPYVYTVVASNPQGGVLNYALSAGPANMTVDGTTGAVTWTAGFVAARVKITVTDGKGGKVVHGYLIPVLTLLKDATPLTISGGESSTGFGVVIVPSGVRILQVKLRAGSGDADLVLYNPQGVLTAVSANDGNSETLSLADPTPGPWLVEVDGYQAYSGVTLSANLVTPTPISANVSLSNLSGDRTSETFYRITVPPGVTSLSIATSGGTGDVDILVRKGAPAVCPYFAFADCLEDDSSEYDGNVESIAINNPAAGDWFLDLFGFLDYAGVKLTVTATFAPLTLTTTGAATTSTLGADANLSVGYATATVNNGITPYATAVFSIVQNGLVVTEAGIPALPLVQAARVFIDYRTGVSLGNGTVDINTGLAMVNPGTSPAMLTFTLRDRSGQTVATGAGILPAGAHRAKYVNQLKDIAPNFNLPDNFSTATLFGSLEISSTQPVSVLGLRLTLNQRSEILLTSTFIADLSMPASSTPLYFAQLADGGGFTTAVVLSNTTGSVETGTISIFDDLGAPLSVRPVGGAVASTFAYNIPVSGTFVFATDGSPATVRPGWVKVTPDAGSSTPVGSGVFSLVQGGFLTTESGIASAPAGTRARIYVDKTNGHDTGVAVANPGNTPIQISMQAFQSDGSTAGQTTINLPANGHLAEFAAELITALPAGFKGIADLSSNSPFVALTLRDLFNGRDIILTSFPAPDVSVAAPSPIIFPQIADGAGFSTQFIFISANSAASVNVSFTDDNGAPLSIGRNP